ncbi:U-box domain-containing 4 [Chlorella sorokiniana]|uniref:U-box domain-containing 4 n=1 Tax=Chlorella sorokiniana TaxID=3076 RepID=A0A2P6TH73_CHLSO|nr:U-box domain-containing 4 [Chlorella sorokiniana]|eukprot:PRW33634.1 U-box domain-containing 4 [Chlorella sorokiniana]
MSTAAEEDAAATAAVHDTLRPKILRFFALFMICGAGINVLPSVAAASVGNCLSLMEAQESFIVKAGCSRLQLLMRLEAARQRAVQQGAARKLLRLLQAPTADEGVLDYAMATLEQLAGCEEGLVSIRDEGGQAVLESYLAGVQRSPTTEDAIYRAQQLLAALAPLGDI